MEASADNKAKFGSILSAAVGPASHVRSLSPKALVEIRDLEAATVETEVRSSLDAFFGAETDSDFKISLSHERKLGHLLAFIELNEQHASKLDQKGHIKIGWVNCTVRSRARLGQCYRCHGYSHVTNDCKAVDRTKLCWRCEVADHKAADCSIELKCCLCAEIDHGVRNNHVPGTMRSKAYRVVLRKTKLP